MNDVTTFVELEVARAARGVRLVVVAGLPSPWSEAAKGVFRMKGIPFTAVRRMPGDKAVRDWTRSRNAPVVMYDDDPPRTGWAEILELAERLAPASSLAPSAARDRVTMFGLANEVLGEGGLLWSARILTIDAGLESEGARGFPPLVASYLAPRYGYVKDRLGAARTRLAEGWTLLAEALGSRAYFFEDRVTALDVYAAAAVNIFEVPPPEVCPVMPAFRAAFESMKGELAQPPRALVDHRDRMYERHLERPMTF